MYHRPALTVIFLHFSTTNFVVLMTWNRLDHRCSKGFRPGFFRCVWCFIFSTFQMFFLSVSWGSLSCWATHQSFWHRAGSRKPIQYSLEMLIARCALCWMSKKQPCSAKTCFTECLFPCLHYFGFTYCKIDVTCQKMPRKFSLRLCGLSIGILENSRRSLWLY